MSRADGDLEFFFGECSVAVASVGFEAEEWAFLTV
jgi:hypothetical protein